MNFKGITSLFVMKKEDEWLRPLLSVILFSSAPEAAASVP